MQTHKWCNKHYVWRIDTSNSGTIGIGEIDYDFNSTVNIKIINAYENQNGQIRTSSNGMYRLQFAYTFSFIMSEYVCMCMCMYVWMYVYVCVDVCVCMCGCVCMCMYVFVSFACILYTKKKDWCLWVKL